MNYLPLVDIDVAAENNLKLYETLHETIKSELYRL